MTHPLLTKHEAALATLREALARREYFSLRPEPPSRSVYGENAPAEGLAAFEAHLGQRYRDLDDQPTTGQYVGKNETSAYGLDMGITYPALDLDVALPAAIGAMKQWREAGPQARAAVSFEMIERLAKRSFELGYAGMHVTGQPFVMAFQATGAHAQDRGDEAIAAALVEQERVPASVVWDKPLKNERITMRKDYRLVGRGVSLLVGCNTFPTWNSYSALFASLVTGNPVIMKPHPKAILPVAITVQECRNVLREAGFDPALVQMAPEDDGMGLAKVLAERDEVKIVDYTGGPGFGHWLEVNAAERGQLCYTEKAGLNTIVVDSTDDIDGLLANIAHSLCLYSGQMCTAPQNIYVPGEGIETDKGHLGFDEFCDGLAAAINELVDDEKRVHNIVGATVNDQVRANADRLDEIASAADGRVILESRRLTHPEWPDAVVRAPGLVALDASREDAYTTEYFGPVGVVIKTSGTDQSLAQQVDTVRDFGAMTLSVYTTSDAVLDQAIEAATLAGAALSVNLTRNLYVNQAAAFSDYHGTGANPSANASYTDASFVAHRFRIMMVRRHMD